MLVSYATGCVRDGIRNLTTHRIHYPLGKYILYDNCPRCEEYAVDPLKEFVDKDLAPLIKLMMENAESPETNSETEMLAIFNLRKIMQGANRIAGIYLTMP
jgi:hypothetical protein